MHPLPAGTRETTAIAVSPQTLTRALQDVQSSPLSDTRPPSRAEAALRLAALRLLAVALPVYAVLVLARPAGAPVGSLVDTWLANGIFAICAVLCWLRVRLGGAHQQAWRFFCAAMLAWTVGATYNAAVVTRPPVVDALWLAFPLLVICGMLAVSRGSGLPLHALLDALIVGACAAAGGAALLLGPVLDGLGRDWLAASLALAYPGLDLLMLAAVVGVLALRSWSGGRQWWALTLGVSVVAVTNMAYARMLAQDAYMAGSAIDVAWRIGTAAVAVSPWLPQRLERTVPGGVKTIVVPFAASALAIVMLVAGAFTDMNDVAVWLSAIVLVAAAARTVLWVLQAQRSAVNRREARTDDLTGLHNRRALLERAEVALGTGRLAGLLLLDLDRFKEVNDSLGHHAGDVLLCQVADRLGHRGGPSSVVARLGGDEFALLIENDGDPARLISATAEAVVQSFVEPFVLGNLSLHVDVSIGAVAAPAAADVDELVQCADIAMYQAKRAGGGWRWYSEDEHAHVRNRLTVGEQLRRALQRGEIVTYYQPLVNLRSGRIEAVEALARWEHPDRGLLAPAEFLAVAEQLGLMGALTERVLHLALDQARQWEAAGHAVGVAVNLAAASLFDRRFPGRLEELLLRHRVPASRVTLEVTETTIMADAQTASAVLARLRGLGVRIALDDYGSGYSSMAYLRDLPIDQLKLDRSFIEHIASPRTLTIVRSAIDLAHDLGHCVVGEGVENDEALSLLHALGSDFAQGFHLARPAPAGAVTALLAEGDGLFALSDEPADETLAS